MVCLCFRCKEDCSACQGNGMTQSCSLSSSSSSVISTSPDTDRRAAANKAVLQRKAECVKLAMRSSHPVSASPSSDPETQHRTHIKNEHGHPLLLAPVDVPAHSHRSRHGRSGAAGRSRVQQSVSPRGPRAAWSHSSPWP